MTEMVQDSPTHFYAPNGTGGIIDRMFTSLPPWFILSSSVSAGTHEDPCHLFKRGLSDHSSRAKTPSDMQAIPAYVFKHPQFQIFQLANSIIIDLSAIKFYSSWELDTFELD